jgi:rubrerythrin
MGKKSKQRQLVCVCRVCGTTFSYMTSSGVCRKYCSEKCKKESLEKHFKSKASRLREKLERGKDVFICPKCRKKHNDGYKDYKDSTGKPKWKYCYECKRLISNYDI